MIDVTDPTAPVVLNRRLHEQGAGHHPIRYHHEAQPLDGDPSVMLVTDGDMHNGCGGAGGVVAVRLTPPANCRSGSSRSGPRPRPARSTSFSSEGSKVYFGACNAGLQVVGYADPAAPKRTARYIAEEAGATRFGADNRRYATVISPAGSSVHAIRAQTAPGLAGRRSHLPNARRSPAPGARCGAI